MITLEQIPDEVVDAADHLDNTRLIIAAALNKWIEIGEAMEGTGYTDDLDVFEARGEGEKRPSRHIPPFPALILRLRS